MVHLPGDPNVRLNRANGFCSIVSCLFEYSTETKKISPGDADKFLMVNLSQKETFYYKLRIEMKLLTKLSTLISNSFIRNLCWYGQIAKKLSVLKPQR